MGRCLASRIPLEKLGSCRSLLRIKDTGTCRSDVDDSSFYHVQWGRKYGNMDHGGYSRMGALVLGCQGLWKF